MVEGSGQWPQEDRTGLHSRVSGPHQLEHVGICTHESRHCRRNKRNHGWASLYTTYSVRAIVIVEHTVRCTQSPKHLILSSAAVPVKHCRLPFRQLLKLRGTDMLVSVWRCQEETTCGWSILTPRSVGGKEDTFVVTELLRKVPAQLVFLESSGEKSSDRLSTFLEGPVDRSDRKAAFPSCRDAESSREKAETGRAGSVSSSSSAPARPVSRVSTIAGRRKANAHVRMSQLPEDATRKCGMPNVI